MNTATASVLLCALSLFLARPLAAAVPAAEERYQINARYSDSGAKKQLSSLGDATVSYARLGNSEFGVKVHARVRDPRDGRLYEFDVDCEYIAAGTRISAGRNRSRYNAAAAEYRMRVERVVPFIYLVKFAPAGAEAERTYHFQGSTYTVRQHASEGGIEAALYEEDALLGKFFMRGQGTVREFEKFRVDTTDKIALTFARL